MKTLRQFLFIVALPLCAGCIIIPYHFTTRPGISGEVINEKGGPIANAQIRLSGLYGFRDETNQVDVWKTNLLISTSTTDKGCFSIPSERKWSVLFIPSDVFRRHYELEVEGTNFQTVKMRVIGDPLSTGRNAIINMGAIKLSAW
jgi:hypothetical protein